MNTLTRSTTHSRLLATIDGDAPAKVKRPTHLIVPDDTVIRVPDYHADGFAVFIGEDATVMVEEHALGDLSQRLVRCSIQARTGHYPVEQGIVVQPHGASSNVSYPGKHGQAQYAALLAADTLTIPA